MIKNFSGIELKVEDRIYQFICDCDCTLGYVHNILSQMQASVLKEINGDSNEIPDLDTVVDEKIYRFLNPVDAPIGEAYDIICQMKNLVVQRINEAHEAQKKPAELPVAPDEIVTKEEQKKGK